MTGCGDGDWAGCLVRALRRVEEAEGEFRDELVELRRREEEKDKENPHRFPGSDPSGYLDSFYEGVCHGGRYDDRRYEPLRAALHNARKVLGRHSALAAVVEGDEGWEQFVVGAFDRDYGTSRLAMVAGLLCRAKQAGVNGLEIAARELQSLLDRSVEGESRSATDALTTGYHVLLFYGLRLSGEVEIAENLKAVPLEHTEAVLDIEVVRSVAPPSERRKGWEGVNAIVEAVPWRPLVFRQGEESGRVYDMGSFYLDGRDFVALLSVFQGAPMVSMAVFPHRTHRTVSLLLGRPRLGGNMGVYAGAWGYGGMGIPRDLDDEAFEQARRLYSDPERDRYREYGHVVSRLSEALARTGNYSLEDQILDVAIALEQMYELDQGEISFKLKMRAACFLESQTEARLSVFRKVGQLYNARSGIVHRRSKESDRVTKRDGFDVGFDVARASLIKLLREGRPQDWNEMVMAASGEPEPAEH